MPPRRTCLNHINPYHPRMKFLLSILVYLLIGALLCWGILLMMHGIGLVETLTGLDRFLDHARKLLKPDGRLIFDSLDVRGATEAVDRQYLESRRKAGIYVGENKSCMDYKGQVGEYFSWLQVDPDTLAEHAIQHGWAGKVILQESNGDYLAVLSPKISNGEPK